MRSSAYGVVVPVPRVLPASAEDPIVYVKTGPDSYRKVKRSEAPGFCDTHGLPHEWEERDERAARKARSLAAQPAPDPGSREELIAMSRERSSR